MAITNLKLKTAFGLLAILCTFVPFVLLIFGALVKPLERVAKNETLTGDNTTAPPTANNVTELDDKCFRENKTCKPGVIIPTWKPENFGNDLGQKILRAVVYFLVMFFFFLGISVIADRFMSAIETITSQEKIVKFKMKNGEVIVTKVRVWNETVSNLTLMALGSSAPEILLAIIEVFGNNFDSGELGPGTIVGSAAFNLFVIIGICVYVIPDGETRRQKHLSVFFCTASWSIFAYIWLYMIIAVISPGRIQVWEAVLTFFFFPLLVFNAYLLDTQIILKKFLPHRYRTDQTYGNAGTIIATADDNDFPLKPLPATIVVDASAVAVAVSTPCDFVVGDKFDSLDVSGCQNACYASSTPAHSPAHAGSSPGAPAVVDCDTGERNAVGTHHHHHRRNSCLLAVEGVDPTLVAASPTLAVVSPIPSSICSPASNATTTSIMVPNSPQLSNVSSHPLTVAVISQNEISPPLQSKKKYDGNHEINPDSHDSASTYLRHREMDRSTPPFTDRNSSSTTPLPHASSLTATSRPSSPTSESSLRTHLNQFQFKRAEMVVVESCGEVEVQVLRKCSSPLPSGVKIRLSYRCAEGTAKFGKHFAKVSGFVFFEEDEREKSLRVGIMDECCYDKDLVFYVILENPTIITDLQCNGFNNGGCNNGINGSNGATHTQIFSNHHHHPPTILSSLDNRTSPSSTHHPRSSSATPVPSSQLEKGVDVEAGANGLVESLMPTLGDTFRVTIRIRESKEYKSTVDKLLKRTNQMISTNTSCWRQQFVDALKVIDDDEDFDDEDGDDKEPIPPRDPTAFEYLVHFLSVFWKVLFATVPPTEMCNGWLCFVVSIFWIGVLTAVVGDVASHVGCTIGMKDTVTAISFVALGTSVPDTFASKIAAIQDEHADNSIGNVTGSNAVNVFLGVGIAWSIAAIYHEYWNTTFFVKIGSLGFALTVFCICALIAVAVLVARRSPKIANGELGGPYIFKFLTTFLFVGMWFVYILLNGLESYCYIPGL